jgi:hypothetical protein
MADIIQMGERAGGGSSWISELLPVGLIAVLGWVAYSVLMQPATSGATGASGGGAGAPVQNQRNQANVATQPSQNDSSNNSPANTQYDQGSAPLTDTYSQALRILQPGQFMTGPGSPVYQGGGLGGLFVTAGPSTPTNFFPAGPVISTSQELTGPEMQKVLTNLANSGIQNAWWTKPTITQTSTPGGLNSAASFQSDIPVGTKHCACPGHPGCGPNDDWTYC